MSMGCQPARYATIPGTQLETSFADSGVQIRSFETKVAYQALGQPRLDVTWVIDNSGSMTEEAAHVRANFQSFISSDAFAKVVNWGKEEVLKGRPQHRVYH